MRLVWMIHPGNGSDLRQRGLSTDTRMQGWHQVCLDASRATDRINGQQWPPPTTVPQDGIIFVLIHPGQQVGFTAAGATHRHPYTRMASESCVKLNDGRVLVPCPRQ